MLSIFLTKIVTTIFDFYGRGRLGREKFIPRGWSTVKNRERDGGAEVKTTSTWSRCYFLKNPFVLERSSWLVRWGSSCESQAKCVIWATFWQFAPAGEREGWQTLNVNLLVFILLSRKHLIVFRNLMSEKKEAVSMLVPGKDLLTMLPTSFWKSLIFQGWYLWKK